MTALITACMTIVSMAGMPVFAEGSNIPVHSDVGTETGSAEDLTGSSDESEGAFAYLPHGELGESVRFCSEGANLVISGTGDITETFDNVQGAEEIRRITRSIILGAGSADEITGICNSTFADFINLVNIELPPAITMIGSGAFSGCTSLCEINLPSGLKKIGDRAFKNCSHLEIAALPEGLETIGEQAFSYDTSIENLVIPSTVSYIGNQAFQGCQNLKDIWFGGSREQWEAAMAEYTDTDDLKDVTVHFNAVFSKYTPEEIEEHRGSGDVDENGITDLTDLSRLSLYLIGDYEFKTPALVLADMDKDGNVTLADLATLRMVLSHKI